MATNTNVSLSNVARLTLATLEKSGIEASFLLISNLAKQQRGTTYSAADIASEVARLLHRTHPSEAIMLAERALDADECQNAARVTIGIIKDSLGQKEDARQFMRAVLDHPIASPEQVLIASNLLIRLDDDERVPAAAFKAFDALKKPIRWADTLLYIALRTADWERVEELCSALMEQHKFDNFEEAKEKPRNNLMWCSEEWANIRVLTNWSNSEFVNIRTKPTHSWDGQRKLRIGYLSSDFREHPTARLVNGLFRNHNKEKFELFLYCSGWDDGSDLRKEVLSHFDHIRSVSKLSDEAAASFIYQDRLDILVELNGPTRAHRMGILALRPVPIQIDYLGWPGSVGGRVVDYVIGDPYTIQENCQLLYPEKVIRIENVYQVNDYRSYEREANVARQTFGLPIDNTLVIGMFNSINKVRLDVWRVWMEILKSVPNSVLWILDPGKVARKNLASWTKRLGVNPRRIVVAPPLKHKAHLARLQCCDIMLDPWPYGGHTSTSDALFAGVPVIALEGRNFAGRVSGALLYAAGLKVLVCKSQEEYVRLAVSLLKNPEELKRVKSFVRDAAIRSSVFDAKRRTAQIELAYEAAVRRSTSGKEPCHLDVISGSVIENTRSATISTNLENQSIPFDLDRKLKLILVCGAWGGGTSAVAGLLAKAGLEAPGPYISVNDPRTPMTYEMKAFQSVLREIASELSVERTKDTAVVATALKDFRDNILFPISRRVGMGKPLLLKHGLASLFLDELADLFDLRIVGVLRPLAEIEGTRVRRNWLPSMGAYGGQIIYRSLFNHIINRPTPFHLVRFSDVLADPSKVLDDLSAFCEINEDVESRKAAIMSVSQKQ